MPLVHAISRTFFSGFGCGHVMLGLRAPLIAIGIVALVSLASASGTPSYFFHTTSTTCTVGSVVAVSENCFLELRGTVIAPFVEAPGAVSFDMTLTARALVNVVADARISLEYVCPHTGRVCSWDLCEVFGLAGRDAVCHPPTDWLWGPHLARGECSRLTLIGTSLNGYAWAGAPSSRVTVPFTECFDQAGRITIVPAR